MFQGIARHEMSGMMTEKTLLKTEEHFRELIENAFDIIMVVDEQGIIRYISPSIETAAGYKREEVVGTSAFEYLHHDDVLEVFSAWQKGELKPKQTITAEMRCRHKDGSYHLLEVTSTNLFHHPLIRGAVLNFRDIEEQKEAREALRRSEILFRSLIENAQDIIMIFDAQARIRYTSPSIKQVFGYEVDELIGQPSYNFIHPDDLQKALNTFNKGVEQPGVVLNEEMRGLHKNGSWRTVEVTGQNLLDHPVVQGVVINFQDITERKKALEALSESEEKYRHIFENALDVICTFDMNLRVLSVSPSVEKAIGYRPEELIGKTLPEINEEIQTMIPDSLDVALDRARRVFQGEKINFSHYGFRTKDGQQKYAELSVAPIVQEGHVTAVICIARDITERIHTEKKLKRISQKVLKAQEDERQRLARDLHDDLGQLLTAIQLNVSRIRNKFEDKPQLGREIDQIIGNIKEAADSLRRLCSGLRPPLLDDLGFSSALRDHALDFEKRWGIMVQLHGSIDDSLLSSLESVTLFRIAQEALTNVLRHAGACKVDISLEQKDRTIALVIQDDGKGFNLVKKQALVTSGLHGMRERADLCGGNLVISSTPGAGTSVKATLPLKLGRGREGS